MADGQQHQSQQPERLAQVDSLAVWQPMEALLAGSAADQVGVAAARGEEARGAGQEPRRSNAAAPDQRRLHGHRRRAAGRVGRLALAVRGRGQHRADQHAAGVGGLLRAPFRAQAHARQAALQVLLGGRRRSGRRHANGGYAPGRVGPNGCGGGAGGAARERGGGWRGSRGRFGRGRQRRRRWRRQRRARGARAGQQVECESARGRAWARRRRRRRQGELGASKATRRTRARARARWIPRASS